MAPAKAKRDRWKDRQMDKMIPKWRFDLLAPQKVGPTTRPRGHEIINYGMM